MTDITHYQDTRGLDEGQPTFSEAVVKGIANGGGLYVPESLPFITLEDIMELADRPYHQKATFIFGLFGVDIGNDRTAELMKTAYGGNFDNPKIAPVRTVAPGLSVLELWHGPTSAFKDMALQCMPVFFSEAVSMKHAAGDKDDYLILVATSGDTGKAALEGFADRDHTRIAVFYPADGVSDLQRKQMVTQRGGNVAVFGVKGNFDDCQTAVKAAFNDREFNDRLHRRWSLRLSSANSINWGRLLPQIVYYVSAYADLAASGEVRPGNQIDVCVPTGNFGNILGAYYAKRIGTPIDRLLCASNENNVLTDFLSTGVYDISGRKFVKTPSPSMDILISSNLERLLFAICWDGHTVRGWIEDLAEKGRFAVDPDTFQEIQRDFVGDFVTNNKSLAVIREVFDKTGYLLDPHTAVAWEVAQRLKNDKPVVVASTAHWAKFASDVYRAIKNLPCGAPLPQKAADLSGRQLLTKILEIVPGQTIPPSLAELDRLEERFSGIVEGSRDGVENAVEEWLG